MIEKVPCAKCGALILPATAERNNGMCIPCKDGKREQIEEAKKRYAQEKKYDPHRALWHSLVMRVHKTEHGFAGLTDDERLYFAIGMLEGEVYNGGFDQFFWNSSGNFFAEAAAGLKRLGASASVELLEQARRTLFGELPPPSNWEERRALLRKRETKEANQSLNALDAAFWKDPDRLNDKLVAFAASQGLITAFIKEDAQQSPPECLVSGK